MMFATRPVAAAILAGAFASAANLRAADPKLKIESASVQQKEDGPPLAAGESYVAGETVFFSCHISGYTVSKERIQLKWDVSVVDATGTALVPAHGGKTEAQIFPEDKNWLPKVRHTFLIPPHAPAGDYRILFHAKDDLSASEASRELVFHVRGYEGDISGKLTVRNLRFLRSEEDRQPMRAAAYRAGDRLFARFEITGFQLGEGNAFAVEYGIAVRKPSGEQLFSQPEGAGENDKSFYPRRWMPGVVSLDIPKDIGKTTYVLVILARDKQGNQSAEASGEFTVE